MTGVLKLLKLSEQVREVIVGPGDPMLGRHIGQATLRGVLKLTPEGQLRWFEENLIGPGGNGFESIVVGLHVPNCELFVGRSEYKESASRPRISPHESPAHLGRMLVPPPPREPHDPCTNLSPSHPCEDMVSSVVVDIHSGREIRRTQRKRAFRLLASPVPSSSCRS